MLCEPSTLEPHRATNLALDQDLLDHAFRVSGEARNGAASDEPAGGHQRVGAGVPATRPTRSPGSGRRAPCLQVAIHQGQQRAALACRIGAAAHDQVHRQG